MKKRLTQAAAAFVALALLLPLFTRGGASTLFIFTAFDSTIARNDVTKSVPEDTMTYTTTSDIFVYYEHFSKLSVISNVYYNTRTHEIVLYNINKSLIFDLANDQVYERPSGTFYTETAKWQNGNVFLPLSVVADAFKLSISYINSNHSPAPILRIDSQKPSISDEFYAQQLSSFLHTLYSNSIAPPVTTTPGAPPTTTAPPPVTTEPELKKLVYLSFEGALSEHTGAILDAMLNAARPPAAFFVPPDAILQNADLLRRAYSEGHSIGVLLHGELTSAEQAVDEFRQANERLKSILLTKTRLVCVEGGAENLPSDVLEALIAEGCRLWNSNLAPAVSGEVAANEALAGLRSQLNRTAGTMVVRLDSGEISAEMLPDLLSYIDDGGYSLLGITEWDRPINGADEIR